MPNLSPEEFWLKAAEWGSYMTSGDPGACMYGFDERGVVQSEEHRQACIKWINEKCRGAADRNDDPDQCHDDLDDLLDYLETAPVEKD